MKGHVKQIFTVNILTLLCKWFVIGGFLNLNCSMLYFHIYQLVGGHAGCSLHPLEYIWVGQLVMILHLSSRPISQQSFDRKSQENIKHMLVMTLVKVVFCSNLSPNNNNNYDQYQYYDYYYCQHSYLIRAAVNKARKYESTASLTDLAEAMGKWHKVTAPS